jgi:hypothetical protein
MKLRRYLSGIAGRYQGISRPNAYGCRVPSIFWIAEDGEIEILAWDGIARD